MENTVINELNTFLKGEQMAIHSYDRLIQDVDHDEIRQELINIQKDHEKHSNELAGRIRDLGGKPENGTGIAGVMVNVKAAFGQMGERKLVDILKDAYDGEDKGIAKVEEIIKGDLDSESSELAKKILKEDHEHLRLMARLIGKFEDEE